MPKKTSTQASKYIKEGREYLSPSSHRITEWKLDYSSFLGEKEWALSNFSYEIDSSNLKNFSPDEAISLEKKFKNFSKFDNSFSFSKINNFRMEIKSSTGLLFLDHLYFRDEKFESLKNKKYLSFAEEFKCSSFLNFDNFEEYVKLVNFEEFKQEKTDKKIHFQKESIFSELVKLNLSRECEDLTKKIDEISERTILSPDTKPAQQKQWKFAISPTASTVSSSKKWAPLETIPYLFLKYYLQSRNISKEISLIPPGGWVQKIAKYSERFSVLKFISKEEINKKMEGVEGKRVQKEYIQWLDPEEKWFYTFLPLINLYFDRFRERYINSTITVWEGPEKPLSLTETDTNDSLSFVRDYKTPIFIYDGIPPLTIGEDLQAISELIDFYAEQSKKQNIKNLEETGLAISNSTVDIQDCLKMMQQELES